MTQNIYGIILKDLKSTITVQYNIEQKFVLTGRYFIDGLIVNGGKMERKIARILCLLLIVSLALISMMAFADAGSNMEVHMPYERFSIIEASEPDIPEYPFRDDHTLAEGEGGIKRFDEWWNAKFRQQTADVPDPDEVRSFTRRTASALFANVGDANILYSPINIWFYLDLLSNLTAGNSRAQILRALGVDTVSAEDALYKALYWDDGRTVWRPASSIWIDQRVHLTEALAEALAANHHASVFQGPMGGDGYDEALRAWLNEQTNGLLKDLISDLGFDRQTGISLCTSLYLRCPWSLPFDKDATYRDVFYSPDGETTAEFMRKEESGGTVYRGNGFSSVMLDLQDGGYVTLILPDPDRSIEDTLRSDGLFDFLFARREWPNAKNGRIKLSLPKLDIMAAMPLQETLARMDVTDVFDPEKAEFSSDISSDDRLVLSSVEQYSRLIMNEDGVEAASIIVSDAMALRIASEDEIEFILNRPFLFSVFSETNIPLFIGVYNTP